jgi:hypothetical protein
MHGASMQDYIKAEGDMNQRCDGFQGVNIKRSRPV